MTTAAKYDLLVEQGATYERKFVWTTLNPTNSRLPPTPVNLTGYTGRLQIRANVKSETVLHEATTENGGISIDAAKGEVTLTIPAASSAAWSWDKGVYDLELVSSSGAVKRFIEGSVQVSPEVTR